MYIAALEIKEVNDVKAAGDGRHTVGGRFVVHHMIWRTAVPNTEQQDPLAGFWPVHEVGRNPDFFDPDAGGCRKRL